MIMPVYVRDISNQRVHKRFRQPGSNLLASFEACNADSAGAYRVLTDVEIERVERDDMCKRCFPQEDGDG